MEIKHLVAAIVILSSALMSNGQSGSFTDPRDKEVYRTVEIDGMTWMAENLRYETENSKELRIKKNKYVASFKGGFGGAYECGEEYEYNTRAISCEHLKVVGRYYDAEDAATACPEGWHLSTLEDWQHLFAYVSQKYGPFQQGQTSSNAEVYSNMATFLKSKYWVTGSEVDDPLNFSIMPDGYARYDRISLLGVSAEFWTSTPLIYKSGKKAKGYHKMVKASQFSANMNVEDGLSSNERSARCVKDN